MHRHSATTACRQIPRFRVATLLVACRRRAGMRSFVRYPCSIRRRRLHRAYDTIHVATSRRAVLCVQQVSRRQHAVATACSLSCLAPRCPARVRRRAAGVDHPPFAERSRRAHNSFIHQRLHGLSLSTATMVAWHVCPMATLCRRRSHTRAVVRTRETLSVCRSRRDWCILCTL